MFLSEVGENESNILFRKKNILIIFAFYIHYSNINIEYFNLHRLLWL